MTTCKADGCTEPHKAHGYCSTHYARYRRGTLDAPRGPRGCDFPDCTRPHSGNGYCEAHSRQLRKGKPLTPIIVRAHGRVCEFPGCGRKHSAKGLCAVHWHQKKTGRELTPIRPRRVGCTVDGCEDKHFGLGLCKEHFERARKAGGPRPKRPSELRAAELRAGLRPTPAAILAASPLPATWERTTKPKATPTRNRGTEVGPLTPLDLGTIGATLALLERHNALDLADTLGLREMAVEARARLAVAS